jgi:hypothetical protein
VSLARHSTSSHSERCLARDTPAPSPATVTNYNVTNSDYALGISRYSIRPRAIP